MDKDMERLNEGDLQFELEEILYGYENIVELLNIYSYGVTALTGVESTMAAATAIEELLREKNRQLRTLLKSV